MHHQTLLFCDQWIRNELSNKQRAPLKAAQQSKVKGHITQTHKGDNVGVGEVLLTAKCQLGSKTCGMLSEVKVKRDERMRGCSVSRSEGL